MWWFVFDRVRAELEMMLGNESKMQVKMERKMVIFTKAMAWFDFLKMIIFHLILFSFSSSFFENEIQNEIKMSRK